MIYDCFTFFNELDLLEIRLNILAEHVDRFVLVEANRTHTGITKPFFFEANRARFSISSKINDGTLVEIAFPPTRVLVE